MATLFLEALASAGATLLAPLTRPALRLAAAVVISLAVAVPGGLVLHALGAWCVAAGRRLVVGLVTLVWRTLVWLVQWAWGVVQWAWRWLCRISKWLLVAALALLVMLTLFAQLVKQDALLDRVLDTASLAWDTGFDFRQIDLRPLCTTWSWSPLVVCGLAPCTWPWVPRAWCVPANTVAMTRGPYGSSPDAPPRPRTATEEEEEEEDVVWATVADEVRRRRRQRDGHGE
jgi:hypothetical protein